MRAHRKATTPKSYARAVTPHGSPWSVRAAYVAAAADVAAHGHDLCFAAEERGGNLSAIVQQQLFEVSWRRGEGAKRRNEGVSAQGTKSCCV
jgi:hypothetical protein